MKAILYARTDDQLADLTAAADRRGWQVVATYREANSFRDAAMRRRIDVVGAWSLDGLGASLLQLVAFLDTIRAKGRRLHLHRSAVDPAAILAASEALAEFERSIIGERVKAGIDRARTNGTRSGKPIGRPRLPATTEKRIRKELASGKGVHRIRHELGVGTAAIQRIKAEMQGKR